MPDQIIRSVMLAVPDPMVLLDGQGQIRAANPPALTLLGNWIEGRSYATVLRQPAVLAPIEAVLAGGDGGEARFTDSAQTGETQFRVRVTPARLAVSGMDGAILHFTDTTDLLAAAEMRSDFVANVSHELRTPLTAVLGFIETLRGPARNDQAAQDRFLGIMEDEARRMNRIVSDLLSLSRVEGQERMRPSETVDLRAVLAGVAAALRPSAEDRGNDLIIDAPDGDFTLKGDRDQLTQVVMNLTENALKYGGPDRPVTVTLLAEAGTGSLKGDVLRIDVRDRGDGIDPLHLPRLTERFYRIDAPRSREMGGTGLGLAIVKHIVNRHRGRLRITSEPGQGSVFSVLLPKG